VKPRDLLDMLLLGAIWGGAFPLLRIASPAFGPVALIGVRTAAASIVLLALLGRREVLLARRGRLFVLAMLNTAVPFTLFSYATLSINAGLASMLNATTPMFGSLVAFLWLGERLSTLRVLGILVGFAGVGSIVWGEIGLHGSGAALGFGAGLLGAAFYGVAASYARRQLGDLEPLAIAAGCVTGSALVMVPAAWFAWPAVMPGPAAWVCAALLGLICTAYAYVLYFGLLPRVGVARSVTVTFLIPVFGILWGALFLHEKVSSALLASCALVLVGTALAMGLADSALSHARGRLPAD
jgi:drug/metabolite transporter (DMT)-like permease